MKLEPLKRRQALQVSEWRNKERQFLRTPYFITDDMQSKFYDNVINNRDSQHRYFAITDDTRIFLDEPIHEFIGMGGITNIEWENGNAEISLIINPEKRGKGYGMKAVDLILAEAFDNMGLDMIYGEVYNCGNRGFWEKVVKRYGEEDSNAELTERKFWDGKRWGSMWFCIRRSKYDLYNPRPRR